MRNSTLLGTSGFPGDRGAGQAARCDAGAGQGPHCEAIRRYRADSGRRPPGSCGAGLRLTGGRPYRSLPGLLGADPADKVLGRTRIPRGWKCLPTRSPDARLFPQADTSDATLHGRAAVAGPAQRRKDRVVGPHQPEPERKLRSSGQVRAALQSRGFPEGKRIHGTRG